jgi:monoamine oxidase
VLIEAHERIGGRAHTIVHDTPLDLGCGWLHSADRNVMVAIAEASGFEQALAALDQLSPSPRA